MRRDNRTALLDAAQEAFAERGFGGASIRQIATAVGIKESSVYNHFPSKQAILEAVLDRAEERIATKAAELGAEIVDAESASAAYESIDLDGLDRLAQGFMELWLHDPDVVAARRVLTLEQYRTPSAGERLRALTIARPLAFQSQIFARLIERGGFRPADPYAAALAFWGPAQLLLAMAEDAAYEEEARQRLREHLAHFRATHLNRVEEES